MSRIRKFAVLVTRYATQTKKTATHLSSDVDTGTKVTNVVFSGQVVEVKKWSFGWVS